MTEVTTGGSDLPIFRAFAAIVQGLAGLALAALLVLVLAEVVLRSFFGASLDFVEEVVGYLVVTITFLGAALALRAGALFQVGFVIDLLPVRIRRALGAMYLALAFLVTLVLVWEMTQLVISSASRGKFSPSSLMTPVWIPQLALPLGMIIMAIFLIEQAIVEFRSNEVR